MSKKQSKKSPNLKQSQVETPKQTQPKETTSTPKAEVTAQKVSKQEKPLTLESIQKELNSLKELVSDHAQQIISMQEALARKRRASSNDSSC